MTTLASTVSAPHRVAVLAGATLATLAVPLPAQSVIEGVSATATSWWTMPDETNPYQAPVNLVNNSRISTPYDITATHQPNNDANGMWHAKEWASDPNPTLTFNLGGSFDLLGVHIWNGNQAFDTAHIRRGVNQFALSVSTDGGTTYQPVGTYNLTVSPLPAQPVSAQHFDLTGRNGVTHVRIRVNSTHNSPAGGGDYACLSEVMFTAVDHFTPVPIKKVESGQGTVTLTIPSSPGQKFAIYRSTDLATGFDVPHVKNVPAATDAPLRAGMITDFSGGATLADNGADFDAILTPGASYHFIPGSGASAGDTIAVLSWSGQTVTIARDISADLEWTGNYVIRTAVPTETRWVDTAPPPGKAFYKAARQ